MSPDKAAIEAFSEINNIAMILLFGSRATDQFRAESDIDIGLLFKGEYSYHEMLSGLFNIFPGQKVDVVVLNRRDPLINFQILSKH